MQQITSRLRGKPLDLLSFDDVAGRLQVTGKAAAGRAAIPLEAIVGSVGRYGDFTRTFLPRRNSDAQRWAHVRAASDVTQLPPIDVYQIGDAYFVLDGNHRVSIARQQGTTHIDAIITAVQTRVPLAPDDDPDTLIVKTEYASFLADTHLHQSRPTADLRVSAAGQYAHLENLIEVHRYLLEEREQRVLDYREAVARWYDEAYMPIVEAIREQGILRYFPKRTEADLYVFIATHQAQLRAKMGWDVAPDMAAANLIQAKPVPRKDRLSRVFQWLRRLIGKKRPSMAPRGSWSGDHLAARYSGQLFADLLVCVQTGPSGREALAQALILAQCERARIIGLQVTDVHRPAGEDGDASFYEQCQAAGVEAQLVQESGEWVTAICHRASLTDAVVLAPGPLIPDATLATLLQQSPRPLLLVPGTARPIKRLLLYYDGSARAREALFAATYMAEQWQIDLHTLIAEPHDEHRSSVQAYLDLHELPPSVTAIASGWQAFVAATLHHEHDMLVLGCSAYGPRREPEMAAFADLLRECGRPLLVCT